MCLLDRPGGIFVLGKRTDGKMTNLESEKTSLSTIAADWKLLYNVCIPVGYAYSTIIGMRSLKLKEDKTVRLTVRQCGDLS